MVVSRREFMRTVGVATAMVGLGSLVKAVCVDEPLKVHQRVRVKRMQGSHIKLWKTTVVSGSIGTLVEIWKPGKYYALDGTVDHDPKEWYRVHFESPPSNTPRCYGDGSLYFRRGDIEALTG